MIERSLLVSPTQNIQRVSVHGGHSGQFCCHAQNSLDEIVNAYISKGFSWVGITEHMPPTEERFVYPDETAAGLDVKSLEDRFADYIFTCRELQQKYLQEISLYVGFESECYTGAVDRILELKSKFKPDYIVGSIHHVNNIPIDMDLKHYTLALTATGGYEKLYCAYFDTQYKLLKKISPEVVGHFDLIRIFDDDYTRHLKLPAVWERIVRNLKYIQEKKMILDFNLRALSKGAVEPYVAAPILKTALSLGIAVVPGDDSHGVASVGCNIEEGIHILQQSGADTHWVKPVDVSTF